MRYTDIDLQSTDIMWFGVDKNGCIAAFFSGGRFCVPEFVCQSIEETELLEDYFLNKLATSTKYVLCVEDKDNSLMMDCKKLSSKGLYCFDISDKNGVDYKMISYPETPVKIEMLSQNIIAVMHLHDLNTVFEEVKEITMGQYKFH